MYFPTPLVLAATALASELPPYGIWESKCQTAGRAVRNIGLSHLIPFNNFTVYMDKHDPWVRGCVTPFDEVLQRNKNATERAYYEEATWYNSVHPTTSQLIQDCEAEELVLGEKTWRQIGLRDGLPPTWKDVVAKFPACLPEPQRKEQPSSEGLPNGLNNRTHDPNGFILQESSAASILGSVPLTLVFVAVGFSWL